MKGDDMDQMEYDPDEGRESECVTCDNDDPCRDHPLPYALGGKPDEVA